MFHNGWEYYIVNPFSPEIFQKTQENYIKNYKECYNKLINSLLIPEPSNLFTDDDTFMYYTTCENELDILNPESDYGFKFLKHKFFEKKTVKIRKDLNSYYIQWRIKVNRIYKDNDKYYIELLKY
tara:strand:+ start:246 stop:620 length:375 start_codon:yes stop_codon:yes gene_type:complete